MCVCVVPCANGTKKAKKWEPPSEGGVKEWGKGKEKRRKEKENKKEKEKKGLWMMANIFAQASTAVF